ncbi:MAG: hypothetical protein RLZ42_1573, partial [Armatimonadota bacterium]
MKMSGEIFVDIESNAALCGNSDVMAKRKSTGDEPRRTSTSTKSKTDDGTLPSPLLAILTTLIVALGAIAAGLAVFWGPPARDMTASTEHFSAARALKHVQVIARAPHPPGTAEHAHVRTYIVEQLRALKLDVHEQEAVVTSKSKRGLTLANVTNIVGYRKGTSIKPGPPLLLMAHYDSVPTGPGAGDDAAGVAAILESLRALGSQRLLNDVYVVITDAEELGLL